MACGLALVARGERDPRRTTTRGVGELIVAARGEGAAVVVVGLGGSATMDGGLGMARALGWEAVDAGGKPLPEGGGALVDLARLVPGPPVATRIIALADVRNRLLGPDGAAVYAPQKGADGAAVRQLTDGLARLVEAARPWDGSRLAEVAGAGAAGGLAFGLLCFAGAELMPGASWVLDRAGFENALDGADLAVVAEAGFDETSLAGKLTGEVVTRARRRGVPVLVLTPDARVRPGGVVVETTPGRWSAADLTAHAEAAIRRALRLPPP
jgi:glycerate kinase